MTASAGGFVSASVLRTRFSAGCAEKHARRCRPSPQGNRERFGPAAATGGSGRRRAGSDPSVAGREAGSVAGEPARRFRPRQRPHPVPRRRTSPRSRSRNHPRRKRLSRRRRSPERTPGFCGPGERSSVQDRAGIESPQPRYRGFSVRHRRAKRRVTPISSWFVAVDGGEAVAGVPTERARYRGHSGPGVRPTFVLSRC